ncbi:CAP domain-containing protein [Camelliibacillus cellulosilyticus]|uniref:CAP domain-containing protein n=1 Tax=Camelliibacillus cellulosilyticus TaxID=2174486 RepID=A0ABV9GKN5_9BACL
MLHLFNKYTIHSTTFMILLGILTEAIHLRKTNIFIFILAVIVFFVTFLFNFSEKPPQKHKKESKIEDSAPSGFKVPDKGLHTFIGASSDEVKKRFGKPEFIDPTAYGYDWWVYGRRSEQYLQIGVENGQVVTIYALGKNLPTGPFNIGENAQKILQKIPLSETETLNYKGAKIELEFKEDEWMIMPLVKFGHVWVQLYFDHFTNRLMSVRYLTNEVLVNQKPYNMAIIKGHLEKNPEPSEEQWRAIEAGETREIYEITNILRMRNGIDALNWNKGAGIAAFQHSQEMNNKDYFGHDSKWKGGVKDRLTAQGVDGTAFGENIAENYSDGIAAVIGWLNSEEHRKNMLDPAFTETGIGVYRQEYTQDFVKYVGE